MGGGDDLEKMLQHLRDSGPQVTPGATPPGSAALPQPVNAPAQPAPLPQPASAPAQNPSLLDRVGHALGAAEHGLGAVAGDVSDHLRPQAPEGYEGMLTPAEIASARPGLLHSIFYSREDGSPEDRYAKSLDAIVQRKQSTIAMVQQARVMAARQSVMQKFPPPTSGNPADTEKWLMQVTPYLAAQGDDKGTAVLQPMLDTFAKNRAKSFEPQSWQAPDGSVHQISPVDGMTLPQGWKPLSKESGGEATTWFKLPNGSFQTFSKGQAPPKGAVPLSTNNVQITQSGAQTRADMTDVNKQVAAFDKLNGPITKAATFYPGFKAASQAALAGNPAAFKTLMSQMAAQLDPALQLRLGTLLYVQNIDPSFKGSLQRYLSEKSSGTLPPDQVRKVIQVVDAVRKEQRQLYENRRSDLIDKFPMAEKYSHSADDVFGSEQDGAGGQPNVNDVEGYLKALRSKK